MPLMGHLLELRHRLLIVLCVFLGMAIVGAFFAPSLLNILTEPIRSISTNALGNKHGIVLRWQDNGTFMPFMTDGTALTSQSVIALDTNDIRIETPWTSATVSTSGEARSSGNLYYLSPTDPFMLLLKISLLWGALFGIPVLFWQGWEFVKPGLFPKERRFAKTTLLASCVLFPLGVSFAWFALRFALRFFINLGSKLHGIEPNIVAGQYLNFTLTMMLIMGIVFELPLLMLMLSKIGLINSKMLSQYRHHAIVILAICSALFTPPDPITMMCMLVPLYILYELTYWVMRVTERKRA